MKYLITGGSGFIGSHLVDRLIHEGHDVIILDRTVKHQNILHHKNLAIHQVDILDNIGYLFDRVDVVFHLAALTRPQWSILHPYETTKVNVDGTIRVLEYVKQYGVKRLVFASTSNIYGESAMYPTPERSIPHPMNAYALSKYVGEQYCKLFEELHNIQWNAIRPFNAYGTRMPITGIYTSAVATFIHALKNDIPFKMFGDGKQRRDFIYIDDIVDQMIRMAHSEVYGEAFNCGSGTNTSINELLRMIRKIMGKQAEPEERLEKQYEPSQTLADINKAKRMLKWEPKVSLEEGLRRTINE